VIALSVETPGAFNQEKTYSAEVLRHAFGTLLQRGSSIGNIVGGLVGATDMQVTAGSGLQVLVGTGEAWIPGSSVSTQGGYLGRVTSSTALSISGANESKPRIETIIAQIKDKGVTGTEDTFSVSVVVGTATSGATLANKAGAGAVPASSLVLAYVLVPEKAVSILSADIENVAAQVAPSNLVGPWVTVGLGSKLEEASSLQTVRVRKEMGGAVARMRGAVKVKPGQKLEAGEGVWLPPSGYSPSGAINTPCFAIATLAITAANMVIPTSGYVFLQSTAVPEGTAIDLDGLTYNLT
jgi:hypothetical protein